MMMLLRGISSLLLFLPPLVNAGEAEISSIRAQEKEGVQRGLNPEVVLPEGIIGGDLVDAGEYEWFARGVNSFGGWAGCGGSLVTPEFVLSAAHCSWETSDGFQIGALCSPYVTGSNCGQYVETIYAKNVFDHPYFNSPYGLSNDFSLIQLKSQSTIKPVNMDKGTLSTSYTGGEKVWAIGFGNTAYPSTSYPDHLNDVEVSYVTNPVCNDKYGGGVDDSMMCAADPGEDACQGDSGGPLYDKENDTLVGITSWGTGCALAAYPGVYSRIADEWDWIKDTICAHHSETDYPAFCRDGPVTDMPTPAPGPTPSPIICEEDASTKFARVLRKDNGEVVEFKTGRCGVLASLEDPRKFCERDIEHMGYLSAADSCPLTCGRCGTFPTASPAPSTPCVEDASSKYVRKIIVKKGSITDVKYGICGALSMNPDKIDKICSRDLEVDGIGSAATTCPLTCRKCIPP